MDPRLLMIDLSGTELTADERAFLAEGRAAGLCLFGRNVRDRAQVAALVADARAAAGEPFVVATDQEGGGVLRIHDVPTPPSAMALGAARDAELTRAVASATARGLRALGVNVDFAPVADVNANPANPVIADRSFGADPSAVAAQVVAFVEGLQREGVAATLKHFPGHGDTDVDSHVGLPALPLSERELEARELVPFRAGIAAGAAAVMSAHIVLSAFDVERPATLSRAVLHGLLRERLGFDGAIFTDALDMRAVADRYGAAEATVLALEAGVDVPVRVGSTPGGRGVRGHAEAADAVARAVRDGRLDERAMERSAARIRRLALRYPARPDPGSAWRDGDEALLEDAARRGLVTLGRLPALAAGTRVALVAAGEVSASAAAQLTARPADELARALARAGTEVVRVPYDPAEAGRAGTATRVLAAVRACDAALFVSTSRAPMGDDEVALGRAVAGAGKPYAHVALWNPYHVARLPGPALVSFGFRDRSARAAADALLGRPTSGVPPVPLRTA